jgi:hypothetical protein
LLRELVTLTITCRLEKVLKCWATDGKEVDVAQEGPVKATKGMTTLMQFKPQGDVYVEPFATTSALGTVAMLDSGGYGGVNIASCGAGHIESVTWH